MFKAPVDSDSDDEDRGAFSMGPQPTSTPQVLGQAEQSNASEALHVAADSPAATAPRGHSGLDLDADAAERRSSPAPVGTMQRLFGIWSRPGSSADCATQSAASPLAAARPFCTSTTPSNRSSAAAASQQQGVRTAARAEGTGGLCPGVPALQRKGSLQHLRGRGGTPPPATASAAAGSPKSAAARSGASSALRPAAGKRQWPFSVSAAGAAASSTAKVSAAATAAAAAAAASLADAAASCDYTPVAPSAPPLSCLLAEQEQQRRAKRQHVMQQQQQGQPQPQPQPQQQQQQRRGSAAATCSHYFTQASTHRQQQQQQQQGPARAAPTDNQQQQQARKRPADAVLDAQGQLQQQQQGQVQMDQGSHEWQWPSSRGSSGSPAHAWCEVTAAGCSSSPAAAAKRRHTEAAAAAAAASQAAADGPAAAAAASRMRVPAAKRYAAAGDLRNDEAQEQQQQQCEFGGQGSPSGQAVAATNKRLHTDTGAPAAAAAHETSHDPEQGAAAADTDMPLAPAAQKRRHSPAGFQPGACTQQQQDTAAHLQQQQEPGEPRAFKAARLGSMASSTQDCGLSSEAAAAGQGLGLQQQQQQQADSVPGACSRVAMLSLLQQCFPPLLTVLCALRAGGLPALLQGPSGAAAAALMARPAGQQLLHAFSELAVNELLLAAALQQQQQQQQGDPHSPGVFPPAAAGPAGSAGAAGSSPFPARSPALSHALQQLQASVAEGEVSAAVQLMSSLSLAFELHQEGRNVSEALADTQQQLQQQQQLAAELKQKLDLAEQQQAQLQEHNTAAAAAAAAQLKEAQEQLEHALMCQICFEKPKDTVLMPCMHFLYCSGCLTQAAKKGSKPASGVTGAGAAGGSNTDGSGLLKCPVCRVPCSGQVVVHLSPV